MTAAAAVIGTIDEIGGVAHAMSAYARALIVAWPNPYEDDCGIGGTFAIGYVDADASAGLSIGDTVEATLTDCSEFDRTMKLTIDELTVSSVPESVAGTVTFETRKSGVRLVSGSFDITTSYDPVVTSTYLFHWTVSNVVVAGTLEGAGGTIEDAIISHTGTDAGEHVLEFVGRYADADPGVALEFETTSAFIGGYRSFPTRGSAVIDAGTSILHVNAIDGLSAFEYAIDAAANGDLGPPVESSWFDVSHGFAFYVSEEESGDIAISDLAITPAEPRTGHHLDAVFVLHNDSARPTTTSYRWFVNDVEVADADGNRLLSDNFVKGDTIRVIVRVEDGVTEAVAEASTAILNSQPGVLGVVIEPNPAYTTDDLVVNPETYDADGDPLTITYEWFVNDVPTGHTGNTLPADAQLQGDTAYVVVTVSDTASSTSVTSPTITIQDTPPQVSAIAPPAAATIGQLVSFNVTAEDPDLAPSENLTFVLDYGPSGMTVDPATGAVTWLAEMPMFDRTMEVAWGITVDDPLAHSATGTIAVTDPGGQYPLARTGIEIPLWGSGLQIGDFDSNGSQEMLIVSQRSVYELSWNGTDYVQSWMYPFMLHPEVFPSAVTAGDIDADGYSEIFVSAGDLIVRLDGVERRVSASVSVGDHSSDVCSDLELADLDNDGAIELICLQGSVYSGDDGYIRVLDATTLAEIWATPETHYGRSLAIGNVDTDAALEIVTNEGYVFDGATFVNEWLYGPGFGDEVGIGDFDGNGTGEIAAVDSGFALRGYSVVLQSPIWEVANSDVASIAIVDLEDDGIDEILLGEGGRREVIAYRYDSSSNTAEIVFQISAQSHGVTSMAAGDVDGDGALEFVWGTGASTTGEDELVVAGRNPDIEVEWTNVDPVQLDGRFHGGVEVHDQLGNAMIAFFSAKTDSGYGGSRLVMIDPVTGSLSTSAELGTNFDGAGTLSASDYDNDGITELFVASAVSRDGFFAAYDYFTDAPEWTSPDDIGNGRGIDPVDLNDDGHEDFVVITSEGIVYAFDVFAQTLIWQSTTLSGWGVDVRVVDLDGDGVHEIIAASQTFVFVYEKSSNPAIGYVQRSALAFEEQIADIDVGDTDGDGEPEILVVTADLPSSLAPGRVTRLDAELNELSAFDTGAPVRGIYVGSNAADEQLLLTTTFARHDEPGFVIAFDNDSGAEVWRSPPLVGGASQNSLHYVDIDGRMQIALGTNLMMYVTR